MESYDDKAVSLPKDHSARRLFVQAVRQPLFELSPPKLITLVVPTITNEQELSVVNPKDDTRYHFPQLAR